MDDHFCKWGFSNLVVFNGILFECMIFEGPANPIIDVYQVVTYD